MKKLLIIFLFLTVVSGPLAAQQKITFRKVDTATYSAYLHQDWNRIIRVGKQGLASHIDYFYLRMRIGYAYFKKKQYRQAIQYYQKALQFNNRDATALEYLYYSYLYGDRYNDAQKLTQKFTPVLKDYLDITGNNPINEISLFVTLGTGATAGEKNAVIKSETIGMDGSQVLTNSFSNYNLNLSHMIGHGVILHHTLNLRYKNEYAMAIVNGTPYLSESQIIRQFSYRLAVDITPVPGLTITPAATYVNYRIPIFYDYGVGMGKNRSVYTYNTRHEGAASLKITKQTGLFSFSVAGVYSYLNLSNQLTGAASLTFYPLGNLNLYASVCGYYHMQSKKGQHLNQLIQSYTLGFKVMKNLWIEGSTLQGDFSNLQDPFSGITYNSLEIYRAIYGAKIYIPLNKNGISIFAGYRHYQSNGPFVPANNVFEHHNDIIFNYRTFTGGIIWKL